MDNSLRPLLEKLAGRKMQLVRFHPNVRIYQVEPVHRCCRVFRFEGGKMVGVKTLIEAGSTLMKHVDSWGCPR